MITDQDRINQLEDECQKLALDAIKAKSRCNAAWEVVMAARELIDVRGFNGEQQCAIALKEALSKLDKLER